MNLFTRLLSKIMPNIRRRIRQTGQIQRPGQPPENVRIVTDNIADRGSFTPTHTGFSSSGPSGDIYYVVTGNLCSVEFIGGTATSNAGTWTITNWPDAITPDVATILTLGGLIDNGINSWGTIVIGTGGTATLNYEDADGNWTASGSKGFDLSSGASNVVTYPLNIRS